MENGSTGRLSVTQQHSLSSRSSQSNLSNVEQPRQPHYMSGMDVSHVHETTPLMRSSAYSDFASNCVLKEKKHRPTIDLNYGMPETKNGKIAFFFTKLGAHFKEDVKSWMPTFLTVGAVSGSIIGFLSGIAATAAFSAGIAFTNPATIAVSLVAAFMCAIAGFIVGFVVSSIVCLFSALIHALARTTQYFAQSSDERIVKAVNDAEQEARQLLRKEIQLSRPLVVKDTERLDHLVNFISTHQGVLFRDENLCPNILNPLLNMHYYNVREEQEHTDPLSIIDVLWIDECRKLGLEVEPDEIVADPYELQAQRSEFLPNGRQQNTSAVRDHRIFDENGLDLSVNTSSVVQIGNEGDSTYV